MSTYTEIVTPAMLKSRDALICARLNLRRAKRLIEKGSSTSAISALYDSLLFGMQYYAIRHDNCANTTVWDAIGLFRTLARAGVFDDQLALNRLSLIVERALWQGSAAVDVNAILIDVEAMLANLGILPGKNPDELQDRKITRTWKEGGAYL
jgi:hypothetical protein